ncbi:Bug family tripartite tricarboxylate transporter substrate binding protein [Rhizobium binxianense]
MDIFSKGMAAGAALLACGWATTAMAQSGPDYFNGKTINYIIATEPGGGYDTYGRLVCEFMQKHLPGSTFVVRNMPGAGNLLGANYIAASKPNGLTIGSFNTGLVYSQLSGNAGVKFDLTKMSWIGKAASEPRVIVVSADTDIKTFKELHDLDRKLKFSASGIGSASEVDTTMLVSALKLPIDVISGYSGNDDQLAIMRGEVQGVLSSRSSFEPFVRDGHGRFLAQIGGSDTDVPQLATLVDGEEAQKAIALVESQSEISRLTVGPEGIPDDILATLRDAYSAATSDPEFIAKAEKLGLPLDPLVGDKVADLVKKALDQSPEMVSFLKQALKKD